MLFQRRQQAETDEEAMRQVMLLLDEWQAPEPSQWFDARMMARFRGETSKPPASLLSRLRDRWLFSNSLNMKPLMAGALALLVMAGGGSYWEATRLHAGQPAVSAAVQDLQLLDNNAQTLQQMDQLLDDNDDASPQI